MGGCLPSVINVWGVVKRYLLRLVNQEKNVVVCRYKLVGWCIFVLGIVFFLIFVASLCFLWTIQENLYALRYAFFILFLI